MTIKLLDYAGKAHYVEVDDATEYIRGEIISGDTVMTYPFFYDTGKQTRIMNFYDGGFSIPSSKFAMMNEITDSYQLLILEEESNGM